MKKVVIDARMVGPALHGVARYVTLMARGLEQVRAGKPLAYEPVFMVRPEVARDPGRFGFGSFQTVEAQSEFLSPAEFREIPAILSREKASLYHSPSFASLLTSPCPWIVTVHDLNHLTYGGIKEKVYYRIVLKRFMRNAARLLTISEFSRKEISEWLKKAPQEIEIVPNAIDPSLADPIPAVEVDSVLGKLGLERGRYFFCLSNPKPHKNVGLLVEAFRSFHQQSGGKTPWKLVLSMKEYADVPGVLALGSLPEGQSKAVLAGSGALFFPSLYEGFGLPPIEAVAQKVPLYVSKIAPHQEALVDLRPGEAHWVEPRDFHGWVNAFHRAARAEIAPASDETRSRLLARYETIKLGQNMDRIYRNVLGI